MTKSVGAAEFKAKCLNIIEQVSDDGEPVLITKRGKPVAVAFSFALDSQAPEHHWRDEGQRICL
ncbi:type II toxin-antitoxin system Phd/YefM family antitoxin [Rhizobium sp. 2YAF20]|uniref:type II toxin-antitoxin system Phd/YefM family antitoxin n=1 Tax=Rhizobium sp. 2YAF20 TaxID=3233027 RepID=UPI003F9CB8DB